MRETWRRWHVWLGWIAGVPLLLWSLSGLVMAARPLAEVGSAAHLRTPRVAPGLYIVPVLNRHDIKEVELVTGPAGARWRLVLADGNSLALDAVRGVPVDRLSPSQAAQAATAAYKGVAAVKAVRLIDRNHRPHELREPVDAWQVAYDDGMRIYVDAWSGEVLAARSTWWRAYDTAWAIHIMDFQGRDDPNNPWIIMLGLLTGLMSLLALSLLPKATRKLLRPHPPAE